MIIVVKILLDGIMIQKEKDYILIQMENILVHKHNLLGYI